VHSIILSLVAQKREWDKIVSRFASLNLLNLPFWGPVPCAFTPHGGSPETVPATSTDTQALYGRI